MFYIFIVLVALVHVKNSSGAQNGCSFWYVNYASKKVDLKI